MPIPDEFSQSQDFLLPVNKDSNVALETSEYHSSSDSVLHDHTQNDDHSLGASELSSIPAHQPDTKPDVRLDIHPADNLDEGNDPPKAKTGIESIIEETLESSPLVVTTNPAILESQSSLLSKHISLDFENSDSKSKSIPVRDYESEGLHVPIAPPISTQRLRTLTSRLLRQVSNTARRM